MNEQTLAGMHFLDGGIFAIGSDDRYPEEGPRREVRVDPFWIDTHPVTNRAFAEFVAATGHVTLAERAPDAAAYPGADPSLLVAGSALFQPQRGPVPLDNPFRWWGFVPGTDWRHPQGPGSSAAALDDHPVVHIAYEDAAAFAAWASKDLPTEAEWEYAARGGAATEYPWGDVCEPNGRLMANYWQGTFPWQHDRAQQALEQGGALTTAVGSFPANGFGLVDMIGNVWEWTSDYYALAGDAPRTCCIPANPRGGTEAASRDPADPAGFPRKVLKGGSHLCAANYCRRYHPAARYAQTVDSTTSHIGFRCVVRAPQAG